MLLLTTGMRVQNDWMSIVVTSIFIRKIQYTTKLKENGSGTRHLKATSQPIFLLLIRVSRRYMKLHISIALVISGEMHQQRSS